jgi:Pyruvate/2-oxoacid:ferredoxin oxidoreductase delta subunit
VSGAHAQTLRIVLYEAAGSRPLDAPVRSAALRLLLDAGYAVTRVARHRNDAETHGITGSVGGDGDTPIAVLGRFEQTQPSAAVAEGQGGGRPVFFCNAEGLDAPAMLSGIQELHQRTATAPRAKWKPWFPVIDFSRCTNCMQCLTFCLFDVYGVSKEKKIEVRNPTNCKTDCPACSRVCPEVAILFPKYKGGPINGDEVREEDLHREKMKVDISALLGGDIYAALRQRSADAKMRFSKERDEKRALDERKRCLAKLQQDLEIPPEVLAALPSLEQIQAKTARMMVRSDQEDPS